MNIEFMRHIARVMIAAGIMFLPGCSDASDTTSTDTAAMTSPVADVNTAANSVMSGAVQVKDIADTIYTGGPILTINDDAPRAEAVAVKDGRIIAVGAMSDVNLYQGDDTEIFDLGGNTMLPGFVDSHGHVMGGGFQALSANLLAPPDGEVTDIARLVETMKAWARENPETVKAVNLIVGFGYDHAQLAELRHPTRDDLDKVSTEVPVIAVHQSGHLGVVNSKMLEVIGITAETPDPDGGVYRRRANGEPDGVLEEHAFFNVLGSRLSGIGAEGLKEFAKAGAGMWASFGYTTGQEGRATPALAEVARQVAAEGLIPIDLVIYPDVLVDRDYITANLSGSYHNHLRVGGAKLTIDGSPQGFTALRDRPYYDPVGDYEPGYKGYPAATMEQVLDAVDWAFANDVQILTHANGEGASDMLIAAIDAATRKYGPGDRRPVLIHGQLQREDQVDSYRRLGVFPSVFPMHTFYWGDWHRDHTVGPVNGDNISPTGWLVKRGMKFGTHHDAPVALPDSMRVLDATVTRRTRSGDILGPEQRVEVMTALKAMTIWPAYQHFEEDTKGSIEVGKLADFVVLSKDPTAIDPETLDTIRVNVTIKQGKVIYDAREGSKQTGFHSDFPPGAAMAPGYELLHAIEEAEPASD